MSIVMLDKYNIISIHSYVLLIYHHTISNWKTLRSIRRGWLDINTFKVKIVRVTRWCQLQISFVYFRLSWILVQKKSP